MLRNDFVSNSSSSSFIVSAKDNKFDILLQDYEILDLEKYVDHFIIRDIFNYYYRINTEQDIEKLNFVTDAVFNKNFPTNIFNTLPNLCRPILEEYVKKQDKKYEDHIELDNKIKEICFKSLKLKWSNIKLHYSEVDNTMLDEEKYEDCLECQTQEDLIENRLNYMNSIQKLDFYRIFPNH